MSTLQECIDLYHARTAARTPTPTGEASSASSRVTHHRGASLVLRAELADPSTPFGRILRELRRQRRMTQAQLASMLGVDHSYVCLLETGRRRPTWLLAQEIASALRLGRQARTLLLDASGANTRRWRRAS